MQITLPELALILLVGPSGAGKSTFARNHFLPTEIISSDQCRAMICDDENDQSVTSDAFEILHLIAEKRLKAGRFTVVDATNVQPEARKSLLKLARQYYSPTIAIVLDMPLRLCLERNIRRRDRTLPEEAIRNHYGLLQGSVQGLAKEGFRQIHHFRKPDELANLGVLRKPNRTNQKSETGPFDLVGDVHGCFEELCLLLQSLGYRTSLAGQNFETYHPDGRKLVFLGDLVDRGPKTPHVLRLVMDAVKSGDAFCLSGNHDAKLLKALQGQKVSYTHGLAESIRQLEDMSKEFREEVAEFLRTRPSHYVFDGGALVAVHAGLREEMHGRDSGKVRVFCLYGETTGETDEFGLPVRYPWATDYRGRAMVIYGHTPVMVPQWINNTLCIDTGCVFGGKLTALRYPEKELVSVSALTEYYKPNRPFKLSEQT
jgi:protein phosphatase